jgi:hypothetical protein
VTQPAAARLAALPVDRFTVVNVYASNELADGPAQLEVDVRALEFAVPIAPPSSPELVPLNRLEQFNAALGRIEDEVARLRPAGPVLGRQVTPEQERYFVLRELADAIGEDLDRLFARYSDDRLARLDGRTQAELGRRSRFRVVRGTGYPAAWRNSPLQPFRVFADGSMEEALRDLAASAEPEAGDADLLDLERRLALLHLMAAAPPDDRPTYLWLRGFPPGQSLSDEAQRLGLWYVSGWGNGVGAEVDWVREKIDILPSDRLLVLRGIHARPLARTEAGTHLFCPNHGNVVPVRVEVIDRWPFVPADPFAFGPVLRTYVQGGSTVDLRTGLVVPTAEVMGALPTFTLAGLPRP